MNNLSDYIQEWMVKYKKNSIKPASYDRLVTSLTLLNRYSIADRELEFLTEDELQDHVNELVEDRYALTTIRKQVHMIKEFLKYAYNKGLIEKPIYMNLKLPNESSVKKRRKQVIAYTRAEQQALKKVLYRGDHPAFYAAIIMMETGMRVGEVLALSWDDILWRRRAVHIGKTIVRLGNARASYVQQEPKSFSSIRTLPLSQEAFDLFQQIRDEDPDSSFIFHNAYGNRLQYEAVRWWIQKACDEAGVPYYGQHVFRHTFATNCYERGCDVKLLSKFLGHSDVTTTYNIYIHLYGDALEDMRAVLG